jgi:site-specific DNA-methyltransferase (adenine-specific)
MKPIRNLIHALFQSGKHSQLGYSNGCQNRAEMGYGGGNLADSYSTGGVGRWPANFALSHSDDCGDECTDDCPVRELNEQSGDCPSGGGNKNVRNRDQRNAFGKGLGKGNGWGIGGDSGGASRFFYQAKPSTKERSLGLPERNTHPTVKSIALMRHLIRLIAAPGSLILDPFTGSGSTAVAAIEEGCRFVGIEQDPQHAETARLRTQHAMTRSAAAEPTPAPAD